MAPQHRHALKRRRVLALAGALATTSALAGCLADGSDPGSPGGDGGDDDDDDDDDTGGDGGDADDALAELVRENRRFALDLYDELVAADPEANVFCSPHSVSLALAMVYAGARGETEDQMAETLRYTLGEDVHEAIETLAADLDERSEVETEDGEPFDLAVENAVWGQESYAFREAYLDLLEEHYDASVEEVDFESDPEAARQRINEWVEERTDEKVEELLPEGSITDLARLVVTNAVYFRASWENPFDEDATEDGEFTALDGSTADVPLMRRSASFPYAEVDGHQVIELPYVGEEVGMVVALPAEGEFEAFEDDLDADRFADLVDELDAREGEVHLPRFAFDAGFSLRDVLSAMGMPAAFDGTEADFSGIADPEETDENLAIHDVYHEAAVTVDETGTEAAAATGAVVGTTSAPADPFEMVVDRPFVFAIRDRPTGTVCFLGRVVDAAEAQESE